MGNDRSAHIIASISTVVITIVVLLLLMAIHLSMPAQVVTPEKGEILLLPEEEFVEVLETTSASIVDKKDASSYLPEPEQNESKPTPEAGTDLEDRGPKKESTPLVTSKEPSDVKVKKDKPKESGAITDKKKQEEEKVKREATNEVANAFKNANGRHNALTSENDKGNSGNNNVDKNTQGTTGTGSGSVGGGWIIPKYSPVRSTVTGSVKIEVRIDKTGHVTSFTITGGTPPAATDSQVKAAIEREIRSRKFSRASYDDAEPATAYITYTFK